MVMGRVARCLVVVVVLLTCGCGVLDTGAESGQVEGYLLYEDSPRVEGIAFVQFVPEENGQITGWMHTAYPASNPGLPSVTFNTDQVQGSVDGKNILVRLPTATSYVNYPGTIEGDEMRLTRTVRGDLLTYEGEEATLEDFGAAAEELATESE